MKANRMGFVAVCLLAASGWAGCEQVEDLVGGDDTSAQAAVDSVALSTTESALLALSLEGATPTSTEDAIITAAIPKIEAAFTPAGCATAEKTAAPNTISIDINACNAGPYGLVSVTGTAVVLFKIENLSVVANLTATDLKANDATITINASGQLTVDGEDNSLAVQTNGGGTKNGSIITRNGAYTFGWNSTTDCFTLVGSWATTVAPAKLDEEAVAWSTTVKDYGRCPAKCPTGGGSILFAGTGPAGASVTVSFDGTSTAGYVTGKGAVGSIPVACQ